MGDGQGVCIRSRRLQDRALPENIFMLEFMKQFVLQPSLYEVYCICIMTRGGLYDEISPQAIFGTFLDMGASQRGEVKMWGNSHQANVQSIFTFSLLASTLYISLRGLAYRATLSNMNQGREWGILDI